MGFEIDKSAEELKQKTSNIISNEQAVVEENAAPLTDAENQDLTYNLSGEAQSTGFTEKEADELTRNLMGENYPPEDNTNFRNNPSLQSNLTEEQNNLLNVLLGRLQFFINKYPNIAKAYLQAGIITFYDRNNIVIQDRSGKPLTIDYNSLEDFSQFNLISFYLAHSKGDINLDKMLQLHEIQNRYSSTKETDENYFEVQAEFEAEKVQIMNEEEKKEYITSKLKNAFNNNDFSAFINTLGEFYYSKCTNINKTLKEQNHIYAPIAISLSDSDISNLIIQIAENNDDISKNELIWEVTKRIGILIDRLSNTGDFEHISKPENMALVKKTCPKLEAEIQKYLAKHQDLMTDDAKIKNLSLKEFRKKIAEITTLEELNSLKEKINSTTFSKAEKQVLHSEFLKKKGELLANNTEVINDTKTTSVQKSDFDEQRIKSTIAFELFKICKTPLQREMTNFILSDKRIYLAKDAKQVFEQILKQCNTQEDFIVRKELLDKALLSLTTQENEFIDTSVLNNIGRADTSSLKILSQLIEINNEAEPQIYNNTKDLLKYNFDNQEVLKFCKRILSDNELKTNKAALETLLLVFHNDDIDNNTLEVIYNILKNNASNYSAKEIVNAANKILLDKDFTKNFIESFVENDYKVTNAETKEEEILGNLLEKDAKIYKEFINSRDCSKEHFYDLFIHSQYSYGKDILAEVCNQQQYSAENIVDILKLTSEKTSDITKEVLDKRNITVNEKVNVLYTISNNHSQMSLIKLILTKEDINLKCLPRLLSSIKTLNNNNIQSDKDEIDPKKIDKYIQLLQNPKSSPWVTKMLDEGWDIETISQLNLTRLKLYANKNNKISDEKDPNKKFFMMLGFDNEEAEEIVNIITKNGSVNNEMKQAAIKLLNTGIPRHRIGKILSSAISTGEYNSKITTDVMVITTLGLNSFLERFLPIANNLSQEGLKENLSLDTRKLLLVMINQIPQAKKTALKAEGFDLDGIAKNLNTINSAKEENNASQTIYDKLSLIDINSATQSWATDKYEIIKNKRSNNLKSWFEFLETEPEIKNNPLIKLIIAEHVTNKLSKESIEIPPSKEFANSILAEFINNFKQNNNITEIIIDGKKMFWKSISQTDSFSSDFTSKIIQIEQLSKNTNWNINPNLLEENNIHFLIDEKGQSQVVMLENKNSEVANIQNREQKSGVPLAYADFIREFNNKNKLTGYEEELEHANENKSELQQLAENKNYKAILEKLGIEVKTLPDGTWEISHYTSFLDNITLSEYGISENELLSNVSKIKGNADFRNSRVTDLHNLKSIDGEVKFGNTEITNLSRLEEINKKKIRWDIA